MAKKKQKKKKKQSGESALIAYRDAQMVPSSTSLTPQGDLQTYMNAVRQYPLLSPSQEAEISKKYYEENDPEAAKILVLANLRLVIKIANEYVRSGINVLDLIQEGNIGLLQAVREYDPYRGVKFSSYASYWIKAYIRSFILRNWSLVKMGTTRAQRALFYRLQKEKQALERMGIAPEPRYLAERLNVKEKEVEEMSQRMSGRDVSLSTPLDREEEGGSSLIQLMEAEQPSADEALAQQEVQKEFNERLNSFEKTLAGKELVVFRERMRAEEPKTLQEIGETYGITRERVRQIEARVTQKLKEYMKKHARFREQIIDV